MATKELVIDGYSLEEALFEELPTEEDFIARDRRMCNCELTYVHRKRHGALGSGVEIRLCCMAKAVEQFLGVPPGTFFLTMDFQPSWEWDCDSVSERKHSDGSIERTRIGPPPRWLMERLLDKGLPIHNLPDGIAV